MANLYTLYDASPPMNGSVLVVSTTLHRGAVLSFFALEIRAREINGGWGTNTCEGNEK